MMHDDSHGGGGSHVMYIFGYLLLRSNCSIFNLSCMTIVTVGGGGGSGVTCNVYIYGICY